HAAPRRESLDRARLCARRPLFPLRRLPDTLLFVGAALRATRAGAASLRAPRRLGLASPRSEASARARRVWPPLSSLGLADLGVGLACAPSWARRARAPLGSGPAP